MIAMTARTLVRCLPLSRFLAVTTLLVGALLALPAPASAVVNANVRSACMSDYFAFCAGLEVGSNELRRCMSRAGPRLSSSCVNALVAAGEVSKAEVNRRAKASTRSAAKPKGKKKKARATKRQYASLR